MGRDVAADARRRFHGDGLAVTRDVALDGAADRDPSGEALEIDADAAVHVDGLAEPYRVARNVRARPDVDVVAEAVEVAADAGVFEHQVLGAAKNAAADGAFDRDGLGTRHEITRDVAANNDFLAERQQVAVD